MATRKTVAACLTRLRAAFRPRQPARTEAELELAAWHEALEDIPDDALVEATRRAVRTCRAMPVPAEIRRIAQEGAEEPGPPRALPPPSDLDRALEDALRFLPPWAQLALDYPTERNGGTPWRELVDRRELVRTIAEIWRAVVPPDADRLSKTAFADRLADALVTAVASRRLDLVRPGGELCPRWRSARHGWWSHEGLRRLVRQLEDGAIPGTPRELATAVLARHLEAGRMPADVADRAIALVHGRRSDRSDTNLGDVVGSGSYVTPVVDCGHGAS